MSKPISSTPRRHSQSETDTDTETGSRVSSPSASEQSSASEDGSEKSAQAPVMKTRQTSDASPTTTATATQNTNSSALPQTTMTSSSPTVKNRQTGAQKRAQYGQARDLPAYQRDTDIKKIKTTKQGGAADILQAPKSDNRWDKFTKAVTAEGDLVILPQVSGGLK
jgi:hypothetical protein